MLQIMTRLSLCATADVTVLEYDDDLREHGRRDGGQRILEKDWNEIGTSCEILSSDLKRSKTPAFRQVEVLS